MVKIILECIPKNIFLVITNKEDLILNFSMPIYLNLYWNCIRVNDNSTIFYNYFSIFFFKYMTDKIYDCSAGMDWIAKAWIKNNGI